MNPAFSVIVFTTVSGMGYGLWLWLALRIAFGPPAEVFEPITWAFALLAGAALTTAGIVASLWHLGKPARVWRAFSQWRTSWMSREGVMALAALAAAVLLVAPLPVERETALRPLALLLAACAAGTVASTAMIYASLKPIPAWRHPLVVPAYLGFALLCGGLAFLAMPQPIPVARIALPVLVALAMAMGLLKLAYWRDLDRGLAMPSRAEAIGLPQRQATVFERPHTEANYITREMAFVVARRHARLLRGVALGLFALVPLALLLSVRAMPAAAHWALPLAAASALAGAIVERWLFFAEARHVVTSYY
ncbi:MAG: dimethyl sulfoxide reductase anchor subunit [Xanthomonadales bacterium]|nr:dimethyl sulfoxide reductase anchor subunit [Xanthomonadales bacterium]